MNHKTLDKRFNCSGDNNWPFGWTWLYDKKKWYSGDVLIDLSKDNIENSEIFKEINTALIEVIDKEEEINKQIESLRNQ